MADTRRLVELGMATELAREVAEQIEAEGGGGSVNFATVSAVTGDWRGEGSETLLAALTALQLAVSQ